MAVPPDVIGGETITSEWGNTIRDWATASVEFGGNTENTSDITVTTTYEDGATATFTKPTDWVEYKIMAWGDVLFLSIGAQASKTRIDIGGTQGTERNGPSTGSPATDTHSLAARHERTGLTATATIKIQYGSSAASGLQKRSSTINYIAVRTS